MVDTGQEQDSTGQVGLLVLASLILIAWLGQHLLHRLGLELGLNSRLLRLAYRLQNVLTPIHMDLRYGLF
jgi:hypothetical protein